MEFIDLSTMTLGDFLVNLAVLVVIVVCIIISAKVANFMLRAAISIVLGLLLIYLANNIIGGGLVLQTIINTATEIITQITQL